MKKRKEEEGRNLRKRKERANEYKNGSLTFYTYTKRNECEKRSRDMTNVLKNCC